MMSRSAWMLVSAVVGTDLQQEIAVTEFGIERVVGKPFHRHQTFRFLRRNPEAIVETMRRRPRPSR